MLEDRAVHVAESGAMSVYGHVTRHNAAILGGLRLYLDFINLFLLLLRVLGRRR